MRISYKWLQDYFEDSLPNIEELAETLTMKAYEVESVENDILNIDVLPNRSHDSLSYLGVAREVAVLFDKKLKLPEIKYQTDKNQRTSEFISLKVLDSKLVPRAMKRVVLDVEAGVSPKWLQEKLLSMGQKSINNIVDITNFVMWETGQPVHAFDLDKIEGDIVVRGAKDGENITTLDGGKYELREGMLVISDSKKALDIAGIKGGVASGIDESTKRVMLSVCNFNPVWIRKTSRALNLRTDASQRFENGISPEETLNAMERLSGLISELAGGNVLEDTLDKNPKKSEKYEINVSLTEINNILGSKIKRDELENILNRFTRHALFEWKEEDGEYIVSIPPQRLDLRPGQEEMFSDNKEDLVEEIGRVYGYENIKSSLPKALEPKTNKIFYYSELLKDKMAGKGFSEVITYSFQDEGKVKIANPLSSDKKYLRQSLRPGLKKAFELNKKNKPLFGGGSLKIFEVGKIFEKDKEVLSLGVVAEEKSDLNSIQVELEKFLGYSGELKDGIFTIEIKDKDLPEVGSYDNLSSNLTQTKKFREISVFPFVLRDIAFWTAGNVEAEELEHIIRDKAGDLLVGLGLFDTFEKDGKISYAFSLVFQSNKRTLTDEEIGGIMKGIEEALREHGWEPR